jgi:hypothetical protein
MAFRINLILAVGDAEVRCGDVRPPRQGIAFFVLMERTHVSTVRDPATNTLTGIDVIGDNRGNRPETILKLDPLQGH